MTKSSSLQQILKNVFFIALSFLFIPLDTFILFCSLLSNKVRPSQEERKRSLILQNAKFRPKTILVTGVSMSKGLALARSFYLAGHNVIGADCSPFASGRLSKALSKFCLLREPTPGNGSKSYVEDLVRIVKQENVDLWCSCSGVASAMDDAEAKEIIESKTSCKAVQFGVETIRKLHEKHNFIEYTKSKGLTVPETFTIVSRKEAESKLEAAPKGRKYIMKPIGVDDANRGNMTLLPLSTMEQTSNHLQNLEISHEKSWILQQFISGPEYCTHSVIINGQIKAFVACQSAELLMHYVALPADSRLSKAMLKFTEQYVANEGFDFSGHLSFDFMIEDANQVQKGFEKDSILYPIECNPRVHTAVVLLNGVVDLPSAYLSILSPEVKSDANLRILTPTRTDRYFWIGHDLIELLFFPFLALMTFQNRVSIRSAMRGLISFLDHLVLWKDGTFERWDPAPFWILYHVYWPAQFWISLRTKKEWSRVNVSTTKMFGC